MCIKSAASQLGLIFVLSEMFPREPVTPTVMIKILKLQKALISAILGILLLVVYLIMRGQKNESSIYILEASGLFMMLGAFLFMYPILFAKKDSAGCVELDPEVDPDADTDEPSPIADEGVRLP